MTTPCSRSAPPPNPLVACGLAGTSVEADVGALAGVGDGVGSGGVQGQGTVLGRERACADGQGEAVDGKGGGRQGVGRGDRREDQKQEAYNKRAKCRGRRGNRGRVKRGREPRRGNNKGGLRGAQTKQGASGWEGHPSEARSARTPTDKPHDVGHPTSRACHAP